MWGSSSGVLATCRALVLVGATFVAEEQRAKKLLPCTYTGKEFPDARKQSFNALMKWQCGYAFLSPKQEK